MKIPEFGTLQMTRTDASHYGSTKIAASGSVEPVSKNITIESTNAARVGFEKNRLSFEAYLIDAVKKMNDQQMHVADIEKQMLVDPNSVDIHDVTIAMSKARLSLNLAKSVIDRLVQGWSEITTTR